MSRTGRWRQRSHFCCLTWGTEIVKFYQVTRDFCFSTSSSLNDFSSMNKPLFKMSVVRPHFWTVQVSPNIRKMENKRKWSSTVAVNQSKCVLIVCVFFCYKVTIKLISKRLAKSQATNSRQKLKYVYFHFEIAVANKLTWQNVVLWRKKNSLQVYLKKTI